ncbi:MAG TPA: EAL domain-containing protein [Burkholderiaceae bacterium]|nr:EAL domain-containing protein [Burkholderiaceae bacterium]HQR72460.1 EAL domain-containing protein [Burkholderiaceae bacterium]
MNDEVPRSGKRTEDPQDSNESATRADLVLLVDDDPVARLLTASALAERNWRVIEADGGAAALELFADNQPDVIVLDALMPEVDGFITCERLRRLAGGEHVPILMLTGLDDETSIARAYEAGATDFFVKSTTQWTLLSERLRYMIRASRMREELAESRAKLSKAQRIARLGSWEWDIAARWVKLSEECFAIAGLPQQEEGLADWFVWSRVVEDERARIEMLFREALAGNRQMNFECRLARPTGQIRVVQIEGEIDRDEAGRAKAVHGVIQDITERKQAEDQIRQLANYDSLTGLPNRRFFRDQFQSALERARASGSAVGVIFIDLDRFKQINDTLGHQVGDQLLREVAKRLHQCVRENDTVARGAEAAGAPRGSRPPSIGSATRSLAAGSQTAPAVVAASNSVARLGGDEFTILLSDLADPGAIESVAQRLLETMRRPFAFSGHELFVTASMGVASYPVDGGDVDTLLRKADIAMYAVKDSGRNGVMRFSNAMNTATAERWRLETALHRALEREELVMYYQPKVNVIDGTIVGAEALMRWKRGGELVPPGEFITVAEESGLIVPITEWAVREVCKQMVAWAEEGMPPMPVSINISGRHIQRANLVEPVQTALAGFRLDARLLELELTETVLMQNLGHALPLLQALKDLGVAISVDDFGTGYSSLSYLKKLPIDTLKIDRSFVRELETSGDNAAIVAAIIAMSKSLKLRVVAEGVETQGQMTRLFDQGCQLMQGFLFSPAVPGSDFHALIRNSTGQPHWRVNFGPRRGVTGPATPVDEHSNGRHHGKITNELVGPPQPPVEASDTLRAVTDGGEGGQRDRALKWATRFIGRDG